MSFLQRGNATLSALTAPGKPTAGGDIVFPAPSPISVRCVLDGPTKTQRMALGAVIGEASAVLYVLKSLLGTVKVGRGYEVRVALDGSPVQVLIATHVVDRVKDGGLSHYEVYLKERAP